MLEPLEGEGEVAPPLVARHRVDLVRDHGAHRPEHLARPFGREDEVERLRGGDEDVGGSPHHPLPLGRGRVARAHQGADLDIGQAQLLERDNCSSVRRISASGSARFFCTSFESALSGET